MESPSKDTYPEFSYRSLNEGFRTGTESGLYRTVAAIDRINAKYNLNIRVDGWKRIGPKGTGRKCGKGWVGLLGGCVRVKSGVDAIESLKASKIKLANKIRKQKGMQPLGQKQSADDLLSKRWLAAHRSPALSPKLGDFDFSFNSSELYKNGRQQTLSITRENRVQTTSTQLKRDPYNPNIRSGWLKTLVDGREESLYVVEEPVNGLWNYKFVGGAKR